MAEYIERDTVNEVVKHAWAKGLEPAQYIDIIPAADVAPVVHGHWKIEKRKNIWDEDMDAIVCSECNKISQHGLKTEYCSRCGAKMDGD